MSVRAGNLFADLPAASAAEHFAQLLSRRMSPSSASSRTDNRVLPTSGTIRTGLSGLCWCAVPRRSCWQTKPCRVSSRPVTICTYPRTRGTGSCGPIPIKQRSGSRCIMADPKNQRIRAMVGSYNPRPRESASTSHLLSAPRICASSIRKNGSHRSGTCAKQRGSSHA
jgi:hypothetical protein